VAYKIILQICCAYTEAHPENISRVMMVPGSTAPQRRCQEFSLGRGL